jgi:hypothetical protein
MKRKAAFVLLLSLIALATIMPLQQALADTAQDRLQVGTVFELASVRGMAYEHTANRTTEAKVSLKLTVTDVNGSRVRFKITSGEITLGDSVYAVTDGQGGALLRKFGWATLQGEAKFSNGQVFKFHLDGMLHLERAGLLLAGLAGGLGNDTEQTRLRLLIRLSRSQQ